MKIITQLVILTLSLLLVNADKYCDNLLKQYNNVSARCSLPTVAITNCCDLKDFSAPSGVFKLKKTAFSCIDVFCNMTTDEGGWIVIQRNVHGSMVSFKKKWSDYEEGFGDLDTEFWYGLQNIHFLTRIGQWEMRVDYQFRNKTWSYLHYNQFNVGSAREEYPLTVGGFTGVGTDHFASSSLSRPKFSTTDNDNSSGKCASSGNSGWWHTIDNNKCHKFDLNHQPPLVIHHVHFTEIKIRPSDCILQ